MSGVTEFAIFPLKSGLDAQSSDDPSARIFRDALGTVVAQPGAQRAIYGTELEDPTSLRLLVDWEKIEDHITFTKDSIYAPMLQTLQPLFSGKPSVKHIATKPFPAATLSPNTSPAIEIFTAHFPAEYAQADQDKYAANFEAFAEKGLKPFGADFRGASAGWSVESDVPNPHKDGAVGKIFVAFIGWTSKEAHLACRETDAFKSNASLLREGPEGASAVHIKPEEFQQTA